MGLDMYLYARKGISSIEWDNSSGTLSKKPNADYSILTSLMGATDWAMPDDGLAYARVELQIGYWRKVNAIHNWIIENLADGVDNCQPIYIPRTNLIDLKILCNEVIAKPELADELLPTGGGFFFGSTEYDEWYFKGLENTVRILTKAIEDVPEGWSFEYQASW